MLQFRAFVHLIEHPRAFITCTVEWDVCSHYRRCCPGGAGGERHWRN